MKVMNNINSSSYFKAFLLIALLYLGFQMKPWTSVVGNIYSGDDNSYYGYVSSVVNDFDFDFSNNGVYRDSKNVSPVTGRVILEHPIGTSVLLIPFYLVAKPLVFLSSWITNSPFDQRHVFFFMFMCSGILIYAYMGGYLLYRTCIRLGLNQKISLISVMAIIWGTILPVYIFKRPIFSHIPGFFLVSLLLYFVVKWKNNSRLDFKHILVLGLVSGGILITRWDDILIVLFVLYFLSVRSINLSQRERNSILKPLLFSLIVFCVFFFTQGLAWKAFLGSYFKLPYDPLTVTVPITNSVSSLAVFLHIFIGLDWGIIYTMFPFVIGLIGFLWFNPLAISKRYYFNRIVYGIVFLIPFMVILKYRQHGSYYGYRYFLSILPFACLGLAVFVDRIYKKFPKSLKFYTLFIAIIVVFNFFLILPFEYNDSTTLTPGYNIMGGGNWINDNYISNAIRIYFISPLKTIGGLFMRGFLGGYIFSGTYLLFPDFFLKITELNPKIYSYYAITSHNKGIAMFYPLLAIGVLFVFRGLINKID